MFSLAGATYNDQRIKQSALIFIPPSWRLFRSVAPLGQIDFLGEFVAVPRGSKTTHASLLVWQAPSLFDRSLAIQGSRGSRVTARLSFHYQCKRSGREGAHREYLLYPPVVSSLLTGHRQSAGSSLSENRFWARRISTTEQGALPR